MLRQRCMDRGARRGAVLVLVALWLTALVGLAAVVLDGGLMLVHRRRAQSTADAAALVAATVLLDSALSSDPAAGDARAQSAAIESAAARGYANDGVGSTVTITVPPRLGPFAGQAGHAEVPIQVYQPRAFSGIFGTDRLPIAARAVARGQWATTTLGLILLRTTGNNSFHNSGTGTITVNGSIIVNSDDDIAYHKSGNGTIDVFNPPTIGGAYVCNTLQVSGNSDFRVDVGSGPRPRVRQFALVE